MKQAPQGAVSWWFYFLLLRVPSLPRWAFLPLSVFCEGTRFARRLKCFKNFGKTCIPHKKNLSLYQNGSA